MAAQQEAREKQEQGMLSNIAGRDEGAPAPDGAASAKGASIGWMGYVGGVLWLTVLLCAGGIIWLVLATGR